MKLEDLHGGALQAFVKGMWKQRLSGEAFRAFLESNLDFARWGFRLTHMTYVKGDATTKVIYDSERCRVRFDLSNIGRLPGEDELYAMYGRLHALNDDVVMDWRGDKRWCWHYSIPEPLLFLDGYSPQQIFAYREKEGKYPSPPVLATKHQSEQDREFRRLYPPASVIWREALIWEHYGDRFFGLFDIGREDLWEEYERFIQEYYRERRRVFPPKPMGGDPPLPRDRIC